MRFAFYNLTSTTKLGGVETCTWQLAQELAGRGHQVAVIGGTGDYRPTNLAQGINVITFPFVPREKVPDLGSRFRKFGERLSLARRAVPQMNALKPHAVIMVKPYDIPAAILVRRKIGAKLCYHSGGGEFFPGYAALARRLDFFCACSAYDAREIEKNTGVRPQVNHYGVNSQAFRPLDPDLQLAQRWGLGPNFPVVASAVRLVAFKGLDVGLRALALARQSLPGLRYLIAGDGPEKEKLTQLAGELGLMETVTFTGPLPHHQLPAFYSLARVGLFPSKEKEALGIAVGEAMACGLAPLITQVGGMPEMVTPGTGVVVPPRDPKALAQALVELFADPARLESVGRAARQRVQEHFTWTACADRLLAGLGLMKGD